jgi:putative amide transporter protein
VPPPRPDRAEGGRAGERVRWRRARRRCRAPAGGLGWYCAWATGVSVFLGLVTLIREDDTKFALLWLLWALLFATFFAVMALGWSTLNHAAGWLAIMEAIATASVPGGLLMIGQWDDLATAWMAIAAVGVIGVFLVLAHRPRPAA